MILHTLFINNYYINITSCLSDYRRYYVGEKNGRQSAEIQGRSPEEQRQVQPSTGRDKQLQPQVHGRYVRCFRQVPGTGEAEVKLFQGNVIRCPQTP